MTNQHVRYWTLHPLHWLSNTSIKTVVSHPFNGLISRTTWVSQH